MNDTELRNLLREVQTASEGSQSKPDASLELLLEFLRECLRVRALQGESSGNAGRSAFHSG